MTLDFSSSLSDSTLRRYRSLADDKDHAYYPKAFIEKGVAGARWNALNDDWKTVVGALMTQAEAGDWRMTSFTKYLEYILMGSEVAPHLFSGTREQIDRSRSRFWRLCNFGISSVDLASTAGLKPTVSSAATRYSKFKELFDMMHLTRHSDFNDELVEHRDDALSARDEQLADEHGHERRITVKARVGPERGKEVEKRIDLRSEEVREFVLAYQFVWENRTKSGARKLTTLRALKMRDALLFIELMLAAGFRPGDIVASVVARTDEERERIHRDDPLQSIMQVGSDEAVFYLYGNKRDSALIATVRNDMDLPIVGPLPIFDHIMNYLNFVKTTKSGEKWFREPTSGGLNSVLRQMWKLMYTASDVQLRGNMFRALRVRAMMPLKFQQVYLEIWNDGRDTAFAGRSTGVGRRAFVAYVRENEELDADDLISEFDKQSAAAKASGHSLHQRVTRYARGLDGAAADEEDDDETRLDEDEAGPA